MTETLNQIVDRINNDEFSDEEIWSALGELSMCKHNTISSMLYVQQQERDDVNDYYDREYTD